MKKLIVLALFAFAISNTTIAQIELKINPLGLLFNSPDIVGEYLVNEDIGVELGIGLAYGSSTFDLGEDLKRSGFSSLAAGKYYFNPDDGCDKFYAGIYLRPRTLTFKDNDDTDGDGLPNYLDEDDDGDNVLTKNEKPDPNTDGNLSDAQDTDADTIPDYLDDDDDGDGVKTRDEENDTQDQNPTNDITNSDVGADYLNKDISTLVAATAYREHTINQTYIVTLNITNISIDILSQDEFDFGTLSDSKLSSSRNVTPDFN